MTNPLAPREKASPPIKMNRKTAESMLDALTDVGVRAVIEPTDEEGLFFIRVVEIPRKAEHD